jgi:integrase
MKRNDTFYLYVPTSEKTLHLKTTGFKKAETAKKVATMVASMRDNADFELLDAVVAGKTTLELVYLAKVKGRLAELKKELKRVPLADFIEPWLDSCRVEGLSEASISLYRQRMQKFFNPDDTAKRVEFVHQLTPGAIRDLLAALGVTSGTARQYLTEVQSFCRYLVAKEILVANPAANRDLVPRPGKNESRTRWVQVETDLAIVNAADEDYRNLFALAHATGADRGDLQKIRRRHVNLEQRTIDLHGSKTKGRRRMGVPIEEWALPFVEAACAGKDPEDLLFPGISKDAISRAHERATQKAKVEDYWLRDGRHSYACRAILRGAPIRLVSRWLGHTNLATTYNVYVHFDGAVQQRLDPELAYGGGVTPPGLPGGTSSRDGAASADPGA